MQGSGKCSWPSEGPFSLFEAIHAELTVVTDLPSFHIGCPLPEGFEITGPVFADDGAPRTGAPRNWTWTSSA